MKPMGGLFVLPGIPEDVLICCSKSSTVSGSGNLALDWSKKEELLGCSFG